MHTFLVESGKRPLQGLTHNEQIILQCVSCKRGGNWIIAVYVGGLALVTKVVNIGVPKKLGIV
jgi:hypothetical protein